MSQTPVEQTDVDSNASPPSDAELVASARAGCGASYDDLMRRYQVRVLHFLQRRASRADSEDLLQETFLRAYRQLDKYQPRWRFAAWLFTIARRVAINHGKRFQVPIDSGGLDDVVDPISSPADIAVEREGRQHLWDMASRILTEDQSTALWLHYVEDLPAREIAAILGRSVTTTKVMIWRSRQRLIPWLQESDPDLGLNPTQAK
jgi:RNA polymerase sigma-70 factor (ECF subfamily)